MADFGPYPPHAAAIEFTTNGTDLVIRAWRDGYVTLHVNGRDPDGQVIGNVAALIETLRIAGSTADRAPEVPQ